MQRKPAGAMLRKTLLSAILVAIVAAACGEGSELAGLSPTAHTGDVESVVRDAVQGWALGAGLAIGDASYFVVENDGTSATVHVSVSRDICAGRGHPDIGQSGRRSVAVSPDGTLLAAGLTDGDVRLWRLN